MTRTGQAAETAKTAQAAPERFKRGDRVEWNFRGHIVQGKVRKRLTAPTEVNGQNVAATKDAPRYVVRSDRSGKDAVRRPEALKRLA
jgi:hypothetical protein